MSSVILVAKILYLHADKLMVRGTQHTRLFKIGSQCITQCTYNTLVGLGESVVSLTNMSPWCPVQD